jgi:ketosteroid isomerase-like protein
VPTLDEFRAFYLQKVDAFNRRDWDALIADLPEPLEWHFPREVVDRPVPARPHELRDAMTDLVSQFPDMHVEPREIAPERSGSFVVRLRVEGSGAASGASIEFEFAQLWEFDGEAPVRVREFMDVSEALAQARQ